MELDNIEIVAKLAINLTNGNIGITTYGLLWFSAIFSAIIDNIPYVATMIPLVKEIGLSLSTSLSLPLEAVINPLWWALALGACPAAMEH